VVRNHAASCLNQSLATEGEYKHKQARAMWGSLKHRNKLGRVLCRDKRTRELEIVKSPSQFTDTSGKGFSEV
jgi:hypothetical protein